VGFEPTIPAFEKAKTVHASDRAATVIGILSKIRPKIWKPDDYLKKVLSRVLVTCRRGLDWMIGFIGYSYVVSTNNYNILNITVTLTRRNYKEL
jgi:hypothetical protein